MKHILLSTILALLVALTACNTQTDTSPTSLPTSPTPTQEPTPLPVNPTEPEESGEALEPGGIDVALELITIPDQETIAEVNGEEISTEVYEEELEQALASVTTNYGVDWNDPENQALIPMLQEQVLDQLIQRELLYQLAEQEGVTVDTAAIDEEIASIQAQIEQEESIADWETFLAMNNLTEEEARELITENLLMEELARKHSGAENVEHVHASHILVETEETAQEVLDRLDEGDEFSDLAAEYSTDTANKDEGGDLGWFPPGVMTPEFEEAAFSLEPGKFSAPVETSFGYHIILVHEKEEREVDPSMYTEAQQLQFQVWFEEQQGKADIQRLYDFQNTEAE